MGPVKRRPVAHRSFARDHVILFICELHSRLMRTLIIVLTIFIVHSNNVPLHYAITSYCPLYANDTDKTHTAPLRYYKNHGLIKYSIDVSNITLKYDLTRTVLN